MTGVFLSFEGGEGLGKSLQAARLAETLTQQLLDAIGKGISLARDGGAQISPGQVVHVRVVSPDLSQLNVPVITSGDVSVTWLAKSVRFGDALPAPLEETKTFAQSIADYLGSTANVIGGMPIPAVQVPVQGPPLKGAIPPAQLRLTPEEYAAFRPLAVLEPMPRRE